MTTTNPTGREPGHAHEAEVEAAALAIWREQGIATDWDHLVPAYRKPYLDLARLAIAAAMPLIRERLAQEIEAVAVADVVEAQRTQYASYAYHRDGLMDAARIVRGATS